MVMAIVNYDYHLSRIIAAALSSAHVSIAPEAGWLARAFFQVGDAASREALAKQCLRGISEKRYRFPTFSYSRVMTDRVFERAFAEHPTFVLEATQEWRNLYHVTFARYPLWKRICWISIPQTAMLILRNPVFQYSFAALFIYQGSKNYYRLYKFTLQFCDTRVIPVLTRNIPRIVMRLFEVTIGSILYLFQVAAVYMFEQCTCFIAVPMWLCGMTVTPLDVVVRVYKATIGILVNPLIRTKVDVLAFSFLAMYAMVCAVRLFDRFDWIRLNPLADRALDKINVAVSYVLEITSIPFRAIRAMDSHLVFLGERCAELQGIFPNIVAQARREESLIVRRNAYAVWNRIMIEQGVIPAEA